MHLRLCTPFLIPFLLLPACSSGGGGNGATGGATSSQILLDPNAGAATDVTVQVEVVALERADGTLTGDLLPGSAELDLVRTDGATEALGLSDAPPGQYVALRLLLAGSEAIVDVRGAARRISLGARELRVPFATPRDAAGALVFGLRHARDFADPGQNGTWSPALTTVDPDLLGLRLATVVAATTTGATITGTLGDRAVEIEIASGAILLRDPELAPLDAATFVRGVVPGARLLVDGVLVEGRRIRAEAIVDLGVRRGSRGERGEFGEIRGVIVDVEDDDFDMTILEVLSGGARLPSPLPRAIEVDTDDARIVQVTSTGERRTIGFAALQEGMTVVVRWRDEIDDDDIDAERIEVFTDEVTRDRRYDGDVESVDRAARTFRLDADDERPDVVVVVGADTEILVRDGLRGSGFDAIREDRDVVVWGPIDGEGRLQARRIVVGDDD